MYIINVGQYVDISSIMELLNKYKVNIETSLTVIF